MIYEIVQKTDVDIKQKIKIQSPGNILLYVFDPHNIWVLLLLLGVLFGFDVNGVKFNGLVPSLQDMYIKYQKGKQTKIETEKQEEIKEQLIKQERFKTSQEEQKALQEKELVKLLKKCNDLLTQMQNQYDDKLRYNINKLQLSTDCIGTKIPSEQQRKELESHM